MYEHEEKLDKVSICNLSTGKYEDYYMESSMRFDHHLDNGIVEKKDLRFERQDDAETFATGQFRIDQTARAVYRLPDGLHAIQEFGDEWLGARDLCRETIELCGGKEVFYINELVGE
jgi:hypothetical protein